MRIGITQARIGSTRFPGKILKPFDSGFCALELHLRRLKKIRGLDKIILAVGDDGEAHRELVAVADRMGIDSFVGSANDVLDRFYRAAETYSPLSVARFTSDCPLLDPALVEKMLSAFDDGARCDYLSNALEPTFPDGQDAEIFTFAALRQAWTKSRDSAEREHVTPYIWRRPERFRLEAFKNEVDFSQLRMTLDYPDDFTVLNRLISLCGADADWKTYAACLQKNPAPWNDRHQRNEKLTFKGEPHD